MGRNKHLFNRIAGGAIITLCGVLIVAGLPALGAAPIQSSIFNLQSSIPEPKRVNIYFHDRNEPSQWELMGLDLPEAAEDSDVVGYLGYVPNVRITPEQFAKAYAKGIKMTILGDVPENVPGWDVCYRGYDELMAYLNTVVARYPNLSELTDIGDSYDKINPRSGFPPHDVWRIRLTNESIPGPKPKFHLVAAHHAREIATPELAMQWIEQLVTSYGVDADLTWLLDHREIYIVPVENPDGWWQAQTTQTYWRKTTNPNGCGYPNNGVDPNRNYPICWSCPGASSDPCSQTYYGPGAGSEPETQNMMAEYLSVRPHFVITLHTYGPYVLYPWGNDGYGIPVDKAGLDALGWNMGRINNTTPRNRVGQPYNTLYNVSGTTDDWTYSALSVPSFTVELGGYSDFNMPCSVLPGVINNYKPMLTYAVKATSNVTQTTYMHAFGPTPNNLAATLNGPMLDISAVISANYGTTNGAVYRIDQLPEDGVGAAMTMAGQNATASADVSGLADGRHTLFVQGKAAHSYNGNPDQWGIVTAVFFTVTAGGPTLTPTPTNTPALPTFTETPMPPTFTNTPAAPTATNTSVPPTVTPTPTLCNVTFPDVNPSDYFYTAVRYLYCRFTVITGYADGTYRPYNNTTRGQLSKIIVRAEGWTADCPATPHFTDVDATNPFYCYIETAFARGIISGYADGTFRYGNNVTRAQLCKIVVLAEGWPLVPPPLPSFTDLPVDDPFYSYVETAFAHGLITGYADGTFHPEVAATRGQIAVIVYRAITAP